MRKSIIKKEHRKTTLAIGAVSADIVSYYGFLVRAVQELAYLYGFEQFDFEDDGSDSRALLQIRFFPIRSFLPFLSPAVPPQEASRWFPSAITAGA